MSSSRAPLIATASPMPAARSQRRPTAAALLTAGAAVLAGCAAGAFAPPPGQSAAPSAPQTRPPAPLKLAPGEVVELSVQDATGGASLFTPDGDERFVLIVASTDLAPAAPDHPYTLALTAPAHHSSAQPLATCSVTALAFRSVALPAQSPPTAHTHNPNPTRSFHIQAQAGTPPITARSVAVGQHAVIWADVTHPTTLDRDFAQQFLNDFETVILPRSRQVFGVEPDRDGDGRIQLVFSKLTRQRGVAFFSACDLMPTLAGCQASNQGEVLYLTPPDAIDPPYNTPSAIKEILAHEVSHLLHFQRKVLKHSAATWGDSRYLTEGIGGLAQDLTGYQAGNLYVTRAGLVGINELSLGQLLYDAETDPAQDGMLRGVGYLLLRYLYDQAGGDSTTDLNVVAQGGPQLLRALLDAPEPLAEALVRQLGRSAPDVLIDFLTALAMSNRGAANHAAPLNPCFSYRPTTRDPITGKQRGADLFARFHGSGLEGPHLQNAATADKQLRSGGVEYLELVASPGSGQLAFTLSTEPEAKLRLRLGRWR